MRTQGKVMTWIGWTIAFLVSAMLTFSAVMKFAKPPEVLEEFSGRLGYPANTLLGIGIAEIVCVVLFLFPRTAILGAILMTGYLGGAVATHVRVGDMFIAPAIVGMFAWLSLFFRDPRVRALLPLSHPLSASQGVTP